MDPLANQRRPTPCQRVCPHPQPPARSPRTSGTGSGLCCGTGLLDAEGGGGCSRVPGSLCCWVQIRWASAMWIRATMLMGLCNVHREVVYRRRNIRRQSCLYPPPPPSLSPPSSTTEYPPPPALRSERGRGTIVGVCCSWTAPSQCSSGGRCASAVQDPPPLTTSLPPAPVPPSIYTRQEDYGAKPRSTDSERMHFSDCYWTC